MLALVAILPPTGTNPWVTEPASWRHRCAASQFQAVGLLGPAPLARAFGAVESVDHLLVGRGVGPFAGLVVAPGFAAGGAALVVAVEGLGDLGGQVLAWGVFGFGVQGAGSIVVTQDRVEVMGGGVCGAAAQDVEGVTVRRATTSTNRNTTGRLENSSSRRAPRGWNQSCTSLCQCATAFLGCFWSGVFVSVWGRMRLGNGRECDGITGNGLEQLGTGSGRY